MYIAEEGLQGTTLSRALLHSLEKRAHSPRETPSRYKNSTPLLRSYSSLSRGMSDVIRLGVLCSAETGKSHWEGDDVAMLVAPIAIRLLYTTLL